MIFYEPIPSEICYIQREGENGKKSPWKSHDASSERKPIYDIFYASRKRTGKMKRIDEAISVKLQPVVRKRTKPHLTQ
ncbi:MAG: hypothetical protein QXW39_01195 [Candidatus Bathyarchaeia archaeon]